VGCGCCQGGHGKPVPSTHYHTCQKREGIVPKSIRTILRKRAYYKARRHIPKYDQRQKTLKWLLVTCFDPNTILPVYINSELTLARIGPFIDDLIENRKPLDGIAVVGVNESFKTVFNPVKRAFRLKSPSELLQIRLETGREFTVTEDHICFVLSDGNLQEKTARNIRIGDFLPVMLEMPEISCQTEIDALQRLLESVSGEDLDKWRVWGPDLDLHVRAKRAEVQRRMNDVHSPGAIRTWLNEGLIPLRYFPYLEVPRKEWRTLKVGYGRRVGGKIYWLPTNYEIDGDLGFFLGYFIGDGSARPSFLRLAVHSDDTDLVDWFEQFFEERFGLSLHKRKEPHTRMFTLQVNSVALVQILTDTFGVARTRATGKLRVPSLILNGPTEAVIGFLGGLIASDGNVHPKRNVVRISSCDYGFIEELAYLANRIGLYFTLQDDSKQDSSLYTLGFSGEDTLAFLLDTGYIKRIDEIKLRSKKSKIRSRAYAKDFPVMESGLLAIARKARTTRNPRLSGKVRTSREAVHTQLQQIKKKKNKLLPDELQQLEVIEKLVNGNIGFARVTKIAQVPSKAEFVYCFEVENHYPGFVAGAGGILSHNCFGYQGYRNARFGRIEAHEAINAWARDSLLKLGDVAESAGFTIIAGIIDSLWIHHPTQRATEDMAITLCREAKQATDLPVDLEGIYKWVVFLPRRHEPEVGVLNRYYGVFRDGSFKVRGIELRRRDTCPLIKRAQQAMLQALAPANNIRQYRQRLPKLWEVFHTYRNQLETRDVAVPDLLVTTILSKAPQDYQQNCHQAIAARKLAKKGVRVESGMKIAYLITDASAKQPMARVMPQQLLQSESYDTKKYIDLLRKAAENLIPPVFQSKGNQVNSLDKFL
ncbi:MAG: DNA polymerase domain-containing protein, partial [Candidatus Hodarchaeales archaeon]